MKLHKYVCESRKSDFCKCEKLILPEQIQIFYSINVKKPCQDVGIVLMDEES